MTNDLAPPIPLPPLTRVAVIGAGGPSGLVAVKQLLEAGVEPSQIVAYEARERAGGVWNYDAEPGKMHIDWRGEGEPPVVRSDAEVASYGANGPSGEFRCGLGDEVGEVGDAVSELTAAMYDRLRTNLPNQIMNYRSTPFPAGTPVFPSHAQIAAYLHDYAKLNGWVSSTSCLSRSYSCLSLPFSSNPADSRLNEVIRWGERVTSLTHTPGGTDADRWTVESISPTGAHTEHVSHVILANGHYNEPYLPPIPGLADFAGELVHARWWRNPRRFRGQDIVVVGSRASGSDVARELAQDDEAQNEDGRTIYQSVRGWKEGDKVWDDDFAWARRIVVVPEIVRVEPGGEGGDANGVANGDAHEEGAVADNGGSTLVLADGRKLRGIKAIVFATGYLYSYPFARGPPFDTHPLTTSLAPARDGLPPAGGQDILNLNNTDTFYLPDPTLALIGLRESLRGEDWGRRKVSR